MTPKIKVSGDPEKMTNPGRNKLVRIFNHDMMMQGDILLRDDETVGGSRPVTACHPMYPHTCKTYSPPFEPEELLVPIFVNGELVYERQSLEEIQANTLRNLERLEPEYKRLTNPHIYKVSLSEKLNRVKERLVMIHR